MRKILFFIQFLSLQLLTVVFYGQDYLALPDSNATWIIKSEAMSTGFFEYGLRPYENDTIILNQEYSKIYLFDLSDEIDEYVGAYRSQIDGKVFYIPTGTVDTTEYLWYDFSKEVGDTVWNIALNEFDIFLGTYNLVVDSTKNLLAGPYNLKCLFLHAIMPEPPGYNGNPIVWVEKIGSLNGGILNMYECGLNFINLHCMDINDTMFYHAPNQGCFFNDPVSLSYQYGNCEIPVWIDEARPKNFKLKIHPNPIIDRFKISTPPNSELSICIYNEVGIITYTAHIHTKPNESEYEPDCELTPGFYILTIQFENKFYSTKILKR
jgi:hypothetical protein